MEKKVICLDNLTYKNIRYPINSKFDMDVNDIRKLAKDNVIIVIEESKQEKIVNPNFTDEDGNNIIIKFPIDEDRSKDDDISEVIQNDSGDKKSKRSYNSIKGKKIR